MTTNREVRKWWEELSTNLRRRMMMTKGPKNVVEKKYSGNNGIG
jgi:hypothetical protein